MNTLALQAALATALLMATDTLASTPPMRMGGPAAVVHLQSGRTFRGQVDPQTGEREFILRSSVGSGLIVRPIQWDRIVRAEIVGETISGPALQRLVAEIRRKPPVPPVPQPPRPAVARESLTARAF